MKNLQNVTKKKLQFITLVWLKRISLEISLLIGYLLHGSANGHYDIDIILISSSFLMLTSVIAKHQIGITNKMMRRFCRSVSLLLFEKESLVESFLVGFPFSFFRLPINYKIFKFIFHGSSAEFD